jgi:hypothetical protein
MLLNTSNRHTDLMKSADSYRLFQHLQGELHAHAKRIALAHAGIALSDADLPSYVGRSDAVMIDEIGARYGLTDGQRSTGAGAGRIPPCVGRGTSEHTSSDGQLGSDDKKQGDLTDCPNIISRRYSECRRQPKADSERYHRMNSKEDYVIKSGFCTSSTRIYRTCASASARTEPR